MAECLIFVEDKETNQWFSCKARSYIMDFTTYILMILPLILVATYIVKVLCLRKIPPNSSIQYWPFRSVNFTGSINEFNDLIDTWVEKSKSSIRKRDKQSAYLTEAPLKWKRSGFCYYIVYSEQQSVITIYYKNIGNCDSNTKVVIDEILTHFQA